MINVNKFSIGATAAITTSMGLIAGLAHGEGSRISIVTGLLIIAIADNISDSLGIHIYKESEGASKRDTRTSTFGNFIVRLLLAFTFVGIVLLFPARLAMIISSIWGLVWLAVLSCLIAQSKRTRAWREIAWHLVVAVSVIAASKFLGDFILSKIT